MNSRPKSWLRIWCKRIGYIALALLLLIAIIYALGWYSEWKEQRQLDEMLTELDHNEPGWRWKDFLPTPLQPGQENGALRFIEFGKTIDLKLLEMPDEISRETLQSHDPPIWLQPPAVRKWYAELLAKTKDQQKSLPDLVGLKRGAVPYKATKPDARKTIGNSERLYDQQSREAFDRSWRFLQRVHDAATSQGVNDLSITALRAYISLFNSEQRSGAGRIEHIPTLGAVFSIVLIRRTLCLTEPSERDLALLQKDCQELTNYLMNADCIRLERALAQGTLDELRDMKSDDPDNTLESWAEDYRLRTPWSSLNGWLREKRLLLPSKERVYRKEYLKHLRFDRQLLELVQMPMDKWYSEWRNICDREVDSSDGRSFAIYIMPRWEKIMSDLFDIQTELCCIEAGIASERYRIKHGVWPKGWDDIVPSLLEKRPVDVKTQQPLLMKRLPNGLVVYGLGHDDTDNGGDVLQAMTPDGSVSFEPDGRVERHFPQDIGFRLFDPAARRQPAPPKPKKTPSPE